MLVGTHTRPSDRDVEAAVAGGDDLLEDTVIEPRGQMKQSFSGDLSKNKGSDLHEVDSFHTAAPMDSLSPSQNRLAALSIRSSSSHILSDEENTRINRKIDRLVAAIEDRRPIHFEPDAETGEVEVFAEPHVEVTGSDSDEGDELERDIAASPENFGRIIRYGNGIHRIRSQSSLDYAGSDGSWVSTNSKKSSSNAWERAVAAANVRFALAHGGVDQVGTVVRKQFHSPEVERRARQGRHLIREVSPIPLDFYKPLRTSTPSIHSNGSELDTSSPLFGKSCEQILRETYAEPPESTFQRGSPGNSHLDKWTFISEPRDMASPEEPKPEAPSGMERAFGVFQDRSNGESPGKKIEKSALHSKALKDVSNLRRPGYLHFNSFAKDAKETNGRRDSATPTAASSIGFEGASNPKSRRAYIKKKWPGLLGESSDGSMAKTPSLDGAARRRNEQAIGSTIDESLYALSHARTSLADSSLNADPTRQAHFDLALARLEGRALPPPPSPINRHPDWAALFDRDVQFEGSHRPLPLYGPMPSRTSTLRRGIWRYFW